MKSTIDTTSKSPLNCNNLHTTSPDYENESQTKTVTLLLPAGTSVHTPDSTYPPTEHSVEEDGAVVGWQVVGTVGEIVGRAVGRVVGC